MLFTKTTLPRKSPRAGAPYNGGSTLKHSTVGICLHRPGELSLWSAQELGQNLGVEVVVLRMAGAISLIPSRVAWVQG